MAWLDGLVFVTVGSDLTSRNFFLQHITTFTIVLQPMLNTQASSVIMRLKATLRKLAPTVYIINTHICCNISYIQITLQVRITSVQHWEVQ